MYVTLPHDYYARRYTGHPVFLGGRYPKLLLRDEENRLYLYKVYRYPVEELAAEAEVAAARVRALTEPVTTLRVAILPWNGMRGTIQPFIDRARPVDLDAFFARRDLLRAILCEHPVDWLIANHDAHKGHFLLRHGELFCVDKGQAFKYIVRDRLDPFYHPNRPRGQAEPIYNLLYRDARLKRGPISHALSARINQIQAMPDEDLLHAVEKFARKKFPGAVARTEFLRLLVERKSTLAASFNILYGRLRRSG